MAMVTYDTYDASSQTHVSYMTLAMLFTQGGRRLYSVGVENDHDMISFLITYSAGYQNAKSASTAELLFIPVLQSLWDCCIPDSNLDQREVGISLRDCCIPARKTPISFIDAFAFQSMSCQYTIYCLHTQHIRFKPYVAVTQNAKSASLYIALSALGVFNHLTHDLHTRTPIPSRSHLR